MGVDSWVYLALVAMAANVAKVLSVKTVCKSTEPAVLVFFARVFPAFILLLPACYSDFIIHDATQFFTATFAAAVLTIFATTLYVKAVQQGYLAIVSPIQASVPIFMIITTYILYDETPEGIALLFILLIALSVGYVMLKSSFNKSSGTRNVHLSPVMMSIAAAALYGVSTVVDRIAISATSNGAILYSACWHVITVLLLATYLFRNSQAVIVEAKRNYKGISIFVVVTMIAFVFQQLSVEGSIDIDNGVTYVKAIVMIHIGIAASLGIFLFKENISLDILTSNLIALLSGVGLILVI